MTNYFTSCLLPIAVLEENQTRAREALLGAKSDRDEKKRWDLICASLAIPFLDDFVNKESRLGKSLIAAGILRSSRGAEIVPSVHQTEQGSEALAKNETDFPPLLLFPDSPFARPEKPVADSLLETSEKGSTASGLREATGASATKRRRIELSDTSLLGGIIALPAGVQDNVFERLSYGDLLRLEATCKGGSDLLVTEDVWLHHCERKWGSVWESYTSMKECLKEVGSARSLAQIVDGVNSVIELWTVEEVETGGKAPRVALNIEGAKHLCHLLRKSGTLSALTTLGVFYYYGARGCSQDDTTAQKLFAIGAKRGYARAQLNLAECFRQAVGVECDMEASLHWFREAEQQGEVLAKFHLGMEGFRYFRNVMDQGRAMRYLTEGAELGDVSCQCWIGWAYLLGKGGLSVDFEKAWSFFRMISENPIYATCQEGPDKFENVCDIAKEWRWARVLEGLALCAEHHESWPHAFRLHHKAALRGDARALASMGRCCEFGIGTPQAVEKAYVFYALAAHHLDVFGMVRQGYFLEFGLVAYQNLGAAFQLYCRAALRKYPLALAVVGNCFLRGVGVQQDSAFGEKLCALAFRWEVVKDKYMP
eukprot:TRINITY_DN662_c0_g1_i1.p1 TRINITY_DN662_c0_g1~~TRINITY_DN662_c0_g1_i1.p1  ORF type:complete len:595 (-),score=42.15 TRINITY_DN662_c0_g1_i1:144-1928(-)